MSTPTQTNVNPLDYIAIQNTISRYCEALDTKVWALFEKVFVPDVQADYPFNSNLKGVDALMGAIQNRIGPLKTHHALTTQTIIFQPSASPQTAHAVTYFIGTHFGMGRHEGKVQQAFGRYIDELVCLEAGSEDQGGLDGVQGASGLWRISKRTVAFSGTVGDEKVRVEFD